MNYLGRYTEAIECFKKAIQIDSNNKVAYYGKGISLNYLGKLTEAIECYDKVIQIDANDKIAYN